MMQFYESFHDTIHVADNPHKMVCGRRLKEGRPLGTLIDPAECESSIFGRIVVKGKYCCPDCWRKVPVKERRIEEYWVEIEDA
jgi:hypothetical protein